VVKAAVKAARAQGAIIKSRQVAVEEADAWHTRIEGLADEMEAVLREEKEEKVLATTEMQMRKADNIMAHEKEILGRPKKTWFQSTAERDAARDKGRTELNGPDAGGAGGGAQGSKEKKRKLTNKAKKKLEDRDERREGRLWKKGAAERGKSMSAAEVAKKGKGQGKGRGTTKGTAKGSGGGKPKGKPRK